MKKSGLADSPFFRQPQPTTVPSTRPPKSKPSTPKTKAKNHTPPSNHDTVIPRHHATMPPQYPDEIIEIVRKAVKEFGKEAATYRFTTEEKRTLRNIIYAYTGKEIRTSENEIARIAINFITSDYKENGENSILHKVIHALKT